MKSLYLIRHAQPDYPGGFLGQTDVALSVESKNLIKSKNIESWIEGNIQVWVSPLRRAKETAQALFKENKMIQDELLKEINFGLWECKRFKEIEEEYPLLCRRWSDYDLDFCFPEGESLKSFEQRVEKVHQKICDFKGDHLAIVCHGGIIKYLICKFLGLSFKNYLLFNIDYLSISELCIFETKGTLQRLNQII